MAKKQKGEVKLSRGDVVEAAVASLKATKQLAGAKVAKTKVEDGNKVTFTLDNGFEVRARVKAKKIK